MSNDRSLPRSALPRKGGSCFLGGFEKFDGLADEPDRFAYPVGFRFRGFAEKIAGADPEGFAELPDGRKAWTG